MEDIYEMTENGLQESTDEKSEEPVGENDSVNDVGDPLTKSDPIDEDIDYEALIREDVAALKAEFPELVGISDITELNNPLRYAALRDLGLTPAEAYMATAKRGTRDTRSHLKSAHGKSAAASPSMMSQYELAAARDLFPGMSDAELQRLYKKVTK